jgi:phosphate starvation-inducible PhoH-like protein
MNNKGEDFTIKGENKHIAARVLQDLTALSTSRPILISSTYFCWFLLLIWINFRLVLIFTDCSGKSSCEQALIVQKYVLDIKQKDCTFGIGPAGTGKTYLAVARAVEALEASDVRRK